ncbi:hypothetical protein CRYUN_Cryun27aG0116400 [Craigia yunnanensis]
METDKTIAIIGSGISGLMACKYTLEKGFSPIVFEARSGIGGVWSQTIESTKLQTPKDFYQFSDFSSPLAVGGTYPDHNQVLEYLQTYAVHFNVLPRIKFNSKVTCVDYVTSSTEDVLSSDLWGGSGEPFSPSGKWNVTVRYAGDPSAPTQVLHSMDYAAMHDGLATELIKEKRVTVIGFQKSVVDIATEVACKNGGSFCSFSRNTTEQVTRVRFCSRRSTGLFMKIYKDKMGIK